jgi:predicted DCC family thiol-disulfide oxidoreductase YuxK
MEPLVRSRQGLRDNQPVLLYDGVCGLCNGVVRWVLARDPGGPMRFAALHGEYARGVFARHPELRGVDSIVLTTMEDGIERVRVRSDAVAAVAVYLGGVWRVAVTARIIPRFLRDGLYEAIARIRYRVFGRHDACPVLAREVRWRFLD